MQSAVYKQEIRVTMACEEQGLQEEETEKLWDKIESFRHVLTRTLNPAKLTAYLRQCRVLDEQDEDEVLHSRHLPARVNRTGRLMDILRTRGRRGYEAFLESMEFYYPEFYIRLTGLEPQQRCSIILDEEGPEGLTQFLMMEVKRLRGHWHEKQIQEHQLRTKCKQMEEENRQLHLKVQDLETHQTRYNKMKQEWDQQNESVLKLKDENYTLAMRYAQMCEEKTTNITRCRDLQLKVDQLKFKLSAAEEEYNLMRMHSTERISDMKKINKKESLEDMHAENDKLKSTLQAFQSTIQATNASLPQAERILLDILDHDRKEALEDRTDLCNKIQDLQRELQQAEKLRDMYLEEKASLDLRKQTLENDCEMYKQRANTLLSQLEEVEKERNLAIINLDTLQQQYSQCLSDKDRYRRQVRELEEQIERLRHQMTTVKENTEFKLQQWKSNSSINTMAGRELSVWPESPFCCSKESISPMDSDENDDCEREINRLSTFPFPPCIGSILRRQKDVASFKDCSSFFKKRFGSEDNLPEVLTTSTSSTSSSVNLSDLTESTEQNPTSPNSLQSFKIHRSLLQSFDSPCIASSIKHKNSNLGKDIQITGGNQTGIFVKWVKEGSKAEKIGLKEGCQLLKLRRDLQTEETVSLDSCSREVGHLVLQQWRESACLTFQQNMSGYRELQEGIETGKMISGDSFYIRTNLSVAEQSDCCPLHVNCNEILHVLDTMYKDRHEWYCARVDPVNMHDLEKGTLPNYSRAQQLMLVCLDTLTLRKHKDKKCKIKKTILHHLRVKWSKCSEHGTSQSSKELIIDCCQRNSDCIMPYSVVSPITTQRARPVIFAPAILANGLNSKLLQLSTQGMEFEECPSEVINKEDVINSSEVFLLRNTDETKAEYVRLQSIQACIAKNKHCLLKLENQCFSQLIRYKIYPIIIYIKVTKKNLPKCRKLMPSSETGNTDVLTLCQAEEKQLEKLPCLYSVVEPNNWGRSEELIRVVRDQIQKEQKKVIWIESDWI
ncbi:caspase recruitment domain-containing protein 10 isoform X2 [Protopterus annectens]|uniref:caspase recruitment domain-containing protein 10 isoform X2 n=1 Tax=Protopterus annectens TaxID=7888 RepID=UPI001CF9FC16|nr:caspase recruitment domain-containing protein 10 isoform X2 [Protopterus annectens]